MDKKKKDILDLWDDPRVGMDVEEKELKKPRKWTLPIYS